MLTWIVDTSLRMRTLLVFAGLVLLVTGIARVRDAKVDVFPEFAPPRVEIQTEAPGLSTEEIEALVTVPLENALSSTPYVKTIRSKSVLGLSSVLLLFGADTDIQVARQHVQERLAIVAPRLPAVAHAPIILPPLSSTSRVLKIGVSSKTIPQMELSETAKWVIRPRLMSVPGVANVAIWGQRDKQIQVEVNPRQLAVNDISLDAVIQASQSAVSLASGGFIDTPNQRMAVRHIPTVRSNHELSDAIVESKNGTSIRVGDVATVHVGSPPPIGDAVINGGPGLLLIVEMFPWGNTLEVTRGVETALDALRPGLPDIDIDPTIFRPASFIQTSIRNLFEALAFGCLLVIAVLIVFLMNWRAALISVLAIPLSLLAAVLVIQAFGQTINTMIIAGLAIALGSVVDDAIIDVENIARRLRLNKVPLTSESAMAIVRDASVEVRSAIVYATAIVIVVFVPVLFLDGLAGSFFRPLALAYIVAVLVSLIVAITITPALSSMLLTGRSLRTNDPAILHWMKSRYSTLLNHFISHPVFPALLFALAGVGALFLVPTFGQGFLPKFQETDFLMHWVEKPGTSLAAMRRVTERAGDELIAIPGVRNFGAHIGRAEVADEVVGPNFTELWISIDPKADYAGTVKKVQQVVDGYPGLHRDLLTYLSERIKEVLSGAGASIVVRIYGPDLAGLREHANAIAGIIGDVPGVKELKVESQALVPQIIVRLRPESARLYGVTEADVRKTEQVLVSGLKVGEIYDQQRINDVVLWSAEDTRNDLASLQSLLIDTPSGIRVPLSEVADVEIVPTQNVIGREGASRKIDVTCNVAGGDLGAVAREIENRVKGFSFQLGYHPEFLGEYQARQSASNKLLALAALSVLAILVLLQSDLKSAKLVFVVFLSLPVALIGGVYGALLGGGVLSLGSLVGFVAVLGIAARNGIMLISHYKHLEQEENETFGMHLILRGAEERLAPILMTALATGLALVPIVYGGNKPGYEIEYPMALVILGGLISSTLLNLFLIPAIYFRMRYAAVVPRSEINRNYR